MDSNSWNSRNIFVIQRISIQKVLGIFRIPFEFRGSTKKADNYVNRFFTGFLQQNFVNNSKMHLKYIFIDKFKKN